MDDDEAERFDRFIFGKHAESGCKGEMYYDEEHTINCTKDEECPVLLALLRFVSQSN